MPELERITEDEIKNIQGILLALAMPIEAIKLWHLWEEANAKKGKE